MLDDDTIRSIARSAANYRRGYFCPAELWAQVLGHLTVQDAARLLDRLPPEAQDELRSAYRERPLAWESAPGPGAVRRVVEEWFRRV